MPEKLKLSDVLDYVESNIDIFHQKRIQSLDSLKLTKVLQRKNPYLFKAKHVLTSQDIVKGLVDAHISSNEETIFGDWLEGLAIFVNKKVYNGWKSSTKGIDLEFDKDQKRYIVSIKSGPNWGNSQAINKMRDSFKLASKTLRTSNSSITVVAINGCCYGKDNKPDKGDYYKLCGQAFWEFISDNSDLYTEIIEPISFKAKERNDHFEISYSNMLNKFTLEFSEKFCSPSGEIDWVNLVKFNSEKSNI